MFLADTLSRAFLPKAHVSALVHELDEIDHKASLPVSDARWHQLENASAHARGWPLNRADVAQCLYSYFALQGKLDFIGQQLVVPISLRKELMAATHASHIGVEACIRRARNCLYKSSTAFFIRQRDHFRSTSRIILGSGSFAVQFGYHSGSGDHLRSGTFAALYRRYSLTLYRFKPNVKLIS